MDKKIISVLILNLTTTIILSMIFSSFIVHHELIKTNNFYNEKFNDLLSDQERFYNNQTMFFDDFKKSILNNTLTNVSEKVINNTSLDEKNFLLMKSLLTNYEKQLNDTKKFNTAQIKFLMTEFNRMSKTFSEKSIVVEVGGGVS